MLKSFESRSFLVQYRIQTFADACRHLNFPKNVADHGLATVIVFAATSEIACARAGKIMSMHNFEITRFVRIHRLHMHNIKMFDHVLRKLYKKAELYGISFHCDFWGNQTKQCKPNESSNTFE